MTREYTQLTDHEKDIEAPSDTPTPQPEQQANILRRVFQKQWMATVNLYRFIGEEGDTAKPKMTRSEKIVECVLAPIFLPIYIAVSACGVVLGLVATILGLCMCCMSCCYFCDERLAKFSQSMPAICAKIMSVCCVILIVCVMGVFFWPIGLIYYFITACMHGAEEVV